MLDLDRVGVEWTREQVAGLTDHIEKMSPSEFNEKYRYLPQSTTSMPGMMSYDITPFTREIVDCADPDSGVREVNVLKGAQIAYTVSILEAILLYFMAFIKTDPMIFMSADKKMVDARIENNVRPMLQESGFGDIIRSSDVGNRRKTGDTKQHLQFEGGGFLLPLGAMNPNSFRMHSVKIMLKDEIDAWADDPGGEGCTDLLSDNRTKAFFNDRFILRGSTPLELETSKINPAYERGDQRHYMVLCKACKHPQSLRWNSVNEKTGVIGGFVWELDEDDILIVESVAYQCIECGEPHFEYDKDRLFDPKHGAHWKPTAKAKEPGVRSYFLPGLYSPIGMQPWHKMVSEWLNCYDVEAGRVKKFKEYKAFYNTVLGKPFVMQGTRVSLVDVEAHRAYEYTYGNVPNKFAVEYAGSPILFLTCTVDVHKENLAVAVFGWTRGARCFVVDYWRFAVKDGEVTCDQIDSPAWVRLQALIEEKIYTADDGKTYRVIVTFIDAGYAGATVAAFCAKFTGGNVFPIIGRDRPSKYSKLSEFDDWETKEGVKGYKIIVDIYKDKLAPILRRTWERESGNQPVYHFNIAADATKTQLKELTAETRMKQVNKTTGATSYIWHRPSGRDNELWDLLIYGHAGVDIIGYTIWREHFEALKIEWNEFWDFIETNEVYFESPVDVE